MKLPTIVRANLESAQGEKIRPEATFERALLQSLDAVGRHAENMSFDESLLEKVAFAQAKLEKIGMADTELRACDFSAATCAEGSFIRVRFAGSRLTGADFSRSTFKGVVFEDCKLDMTNFRAAKFIRVRFINCVLAETDFQMSELTDVEFASSQLEKTEFANCKLQRVDARSSQLFDIRGWQSLRGLTIDAVQLMAVAPELAAELGITVQD